MKKLKSAATEKIDIKILVLDLIKPALFLRGIIRKIRIIILYKAKKMALKKWKFLKKFSNCNASCLWGPSTAVPC